MKRLVWLITPVKGYKSPIEIEIEREEDLQEVLEDLFIISRPKIERALEGGWIALCSNCSWVMRSYSKEEVAQIQASHCGQHDQAVHLDRYYRQPVAEFWFQYPTRRVFGVVVPEVSLFWDLRASPRYSPDEHGEAEGLWAAPIHADVPAAEVDATWFQAPLTLAPPHSSTRDARYWWSRALPIEWWGEDRASIEKNFPEALVAWDYYCSCGRPIFEDETYFPQFGPKKDW